MNENGISIFRLSPSFFSLLAGSFIGASTNLLTNSYGQDLHDYYLYILVFLFLLSSLCFIWISMILEEIHQNNKSKDDIEEAINDELPKLWRLLLTGILLVLLSIFIFLTKDLSLNTLSNIIYKKEGI